MTEIVGFYRASSYASALLRVVILHVSLSVRLSHTRVFCDKTKQYTADILIVIPHERATTLVFSHQQWWVGDATPLSV